MHINISNVEEIIFYDKNISKILPEFTNQFNQWKFALRFPDFKQLGKQALLDFMNGINEEHIEKLENYLGTKIVIDKLNYHIVENYNINLERSEEMLNSIQSFLQFSVSRDKDQLYILFWR